MSVLHLFIGIQGTGKTTYGRLLNMIRNITLISTDAIRDELKTYESEKDVFMVAFQRIIDCINSGKDCIYDATNITVEVRKRLIETLKSMGMKECDIYAYYFIPNVEVSTKRVIERNKDPKERYLPIEVIQQYADQLEKPTLEEGFKEIFEIDCSLKCKTNLNL